MSYLENILESELVNMVQFLLMLFFALTALLPSGAMSKEAPAIEPPVSHATRLMVFSPHPDDETLGAGGLLLDDVRK